MQAAEAGERPAAHPNVWLIAPDLFEGLAYEQLDEIEASLSAVTQTDGARSLHEEAGSAQRQRAPALRQ